MTTLKLGDTIKKDDNVYVIEYLDESKIKVSATDKQIQEFTVDEFKQFANGAELIGRNDNNGYARQNGLLKGVKIRIQVDSTVFKGIIENLTEDMIQVRLSGVPKPIYIDFQYKGLPDGIQSITVYKSSKRAVEEVKYLGEEEGTIYVNVPEHQYRFPLNLQLSDLMDNLLMYYPMGQRDIQTIREVNNALNRFKILRDLSSIKDENGNIVEPIKPLNDNRPLEHRISGLKESIKWIIPIGEISRRLYYDEEGLLDEDIGATDEDDYSWASFSVLAEISDKNKNKSYNLDETDAHIFLREHKAVQYDKQEGVMPYDKYIRIINNLLESYEVKQGKSTIEVGHDTDVVIRNMTGYKSSVFLRSSEKVQQTRFDTRRAMSAYTRLSTKLTDTDLKMRDIVTTANDIQGSADKVNLKGYVLLPHAYMRMSGAMLPSSSVYDKAQMAQTPYRIIYPMGCPVPSLNKLPTVSKIINDIKRGRADKYGILNQSITSLYTLVRQLESYGIYHNELNVVDYRDAMDVIRVSIENIKQITKEHKKLAKGIRSSNKTINIIGHKLIEALRVIASNTPYESIYDNVLTYDTLTGIMESDCGDIFTKAFALKNEDLYVNQDMLEEMRQLAANIEIQDTEVCQHKNTDLKFARKYYLKDKMEKDLTFEKSFDTTPYDLRDEIMKAYKETQGAMIGDDMDVQAPVNILDKPFKSYLISEVVKNKAFMLYVGEDFDDVIEDMIKGYKKIREGNVAALVTDGVYTYYRRIGDEWILEKTLTDKYKNVPAEALTDIFCNVEPECAHVRTECHGLNYYKAEHQKTEMDELLASYDVLTETQMEYRHRTFMYKLYSRLISYNPPTHTRPYKSVIASSKELIEKGMKISPHNNLFDRIMNITDQVMRHKKIREFVDEYTRPSKSDENRFWYYCRITGAKLVPTFMYELATVSIDNYGEKLAQIINTQGMMSPDGDKHIDKYTGYTIASIRWTENEEYAADGSLMVRRTVVEDDLDTKLLNREFEIVAKLDEEQNRYKNMSPDKQLLYKGLYELRQIITVELSDTEFNRILDNAYTLLVAQKQNIKNEEGKHEIMGIILVCNLLMVIQIAIPSKSLKAIAVGCAATHLRGIPVYEDTYDKSKTETYSGLNYILCAIKAYSSLVIFKHLNKDRCATLLNILKTSSSYMNDVIRKKREIEKWKKGRGTEAENLNHNEYKQHVQATQLDVQRWHTFLPSLKKVNPHIPNTSVITSFIYKFNDILEKELSKEEPLLTTMKGIRYLQNVCCKNAEVDMRTYLDGKHKDIKKILDYLDKKFVRPVDSLKMIIFPIDTKWKYSKLSTVISTDIYGFIAYMLRNHEVPELEDKLTILRGLTFIGTETLNEKIKIINKHVSMSNVEVNILLRNASKMSSIYSPVVEEVSIPDNIQKVMDGSLDQIISHIKLLKTSGLFINTDKSLGKKYDRVILNFGKHDGLMVEMDDDTLEPIVLGNVEYINFLKEMLYTLWYVMVAFYYKTDQDENNYYGENHIPKDVLLNHFKISPVHMMGIEQIEAEMYALVAKDYKNSANVDIMRWREILKDHMAVIDGITVTKDVIKSRILLEWALLSSMNAILIEINMLSGTDKDDNISYLKNRMRIFWDVFHDQYVVRFKSRDDIKAETLKISNFEKNEMMKRLREMSVSGKQAEQIMKTHKLGEWGIGAADAFRVYNQDIFEREQLQYERYMDDQRQQAGILEAEGYAEGIAEGYLGVMADDDDGEYDYE
jgi:hypothetical protein